MIDVVELFVKLLASGVLGVAGWGLYNLIRAKWPVLNDLAVWITRPIVGLLCCLIVLPVLAFGVLMQWVPNPGAWRGWVTQVMTYGVVAFLASQEAHGVAEQVRKNAETAKLIALTKVQ